MNTKIYTLQSTRDLNNIFIKIMFLCLKKILKKINLLDTNKKY